MVGTAAAFNLTSHRAHQVVINWLGADIDVWHMLLLHGLAGAAYVNALVAFPHGRFLRRRGFWAIAVMVVANFALIYFALGTATDHILTYLAFYGVATPMIGVIAQRHRYRHEADPTLRQQSRLMMWALIATIAVAYLLTGLTVAAGQSQLFGLSAESLVNTIFRLCRTLFTVIPVALLMSLLRLRLWDAERLISRAMVYAGLVTLISAVHVTLVVVAADSFGAKPGTAVFLTATALLATLFGPMRDKAAKLADRLLYGRPYQTLAALSRRLAEVTDVSDVLPHSAKAAALTVNADYAIVQLGSRTATYGVPGDAVQTTVPSGEGQITVGTPRKLTRRQRSLLTALAKHAAVGLHNARLADDLAGRNAELTQQTQELAASRDRLTAAHDAESRRLERDLHDGTQQLLVALRVHLTLLEQQRGTSSARATLHRLQNMASDALSQIHELSAGLSPQLLASHGLAAALAPHVSTLDSRVTQRYPPTIELATYYACLEALQNVAKHAPGAKVTLHLVPSEGFLDFEVADDGPGFDPAAAVHGKGLTNMADRIATVGGQLTVRSSPTGTTVSGRLPAQRV
jgi:signal transduction histidine kinase